MTKGFDDVLKMKKAQLFIDQVDFNEYPEYCLYIAYPICLSIIRERLINGFYRRKEVSILIIHCKSKI